LIWGAHYRIYWVVVPEKCKDAIGGSMQDNYYILVAQLVEQWRLNLGGSGSKLTQTLKKNCFNKLLGNTTEYIR
jgi:hypothetical protein